MIDFIQQQNFFLFLMNTLLAVLQFRYWQRQKRIKAPSHATQRWHVIAFVFIGACWLYVLWVSSSTGPSLHLDKNGTIRVPARRRTHRQDRISAPSVAVAIAAQASRTRRM